MGEPIVLLHGFSGTRRTWDRVVALLGAERYSPQALELRGHGAAGERRPIGFAEVVEDVLAAAPARFVLCGYSMGARIALHVALAAPERVTRLVLIGATAGIEDDAERAARRASDEALAARLERGTIEEFAATWRDQPLFAGDPAWVAEEARGDQRRNDPAALAAVLRGLGTGVMEPLWARLGELTMPVTLVAGERDAKFRDLAERLRAGLPDARVAVVPGAGHAVHLEAPGALVDLITER
jgi:2-succinyl-6-hydroxy-2,4-cyclohexadiene-1-carboxylate synthase